MSSLKPLRNHPHTWCASPRTIGGSPKPSCRMDLICYAESAIAGYWGPSSTQRAAWLFELLGQLIAPIMTSNMPKNERTWPLWRPCLMTGRPLFETSMDPTWQTQGRENFFERGSRKGWVGTLYACALRGYNFLNGDAGSKRNCVRRPFGRTDQFPRTSRERKGVNFAFEVWTHLFHSFGQGRIPLFH